MRDSDRSQLFARARGEATPTDNDRRRVRAALARKLGGSAAGAAVGTTAVKAAASVAPTAGAVATMASGLVVAKVAIAVVATLAIVSLSMPVRRNNPSAGRAGKATMSASAPHVPSPVRDVTAAPDIPPVPALDDLDPTLASSATPSDPPKPVPSSIRAAVQPSERRMQPSIGTTEAHTATSDTVPSSATEAPVNVAPNLAPSNSAAQVELVARMQAALRAGDSTEALALVREHERLFPGSALSPERDGVRVLAMCMQSQPRDAHTFGQAFVDTHPRSPLAGRVRATCGLDVDRP